MSLRDRQARSTDVNIVVVWGLVSLRDRQALSTDVNIVGGGGLLVSLRDRQARS